MSQASPDGLDNLRTALTGAGGGMVLVELIRRAGDAWQKRQQAQADQRQAQSKQQADANQVLRLYLEQRTQDLQAQVQRLAEDAADRERRFATEAASHVRRIDELERREARVAQAVAEFVGVISALLPGMPDNVQRRVQNALDRLRQIGGLG
jgi:hypothetical protein